MFSKCLVQIHSGLAIQEEMAIIGLIEVHDSQVEYGLYFLTKRREMLKKWSLDGMIHYLQKKAVKADREIDMQRKRYGLLLVEDLSGALYGFVKDGKDKGKYSAGDVDKAYSLWEIASQKFKDYDEFLKKSESNRQVNEENIKVERKFREAFNRYEFEDYIISIPIEKARSFCDGYAFYYFDPRNPNAPHMRTTFTYKYFGSS